MKIFRPKIASEQFELSKHAVDQSIIRQIRLHEIVEAIANGQIIEDYPNDKYAPSCLICGMTQTGKTIQSISKAAILAAHWLKSLQYMNPIRINGIATSQ